MDNNSEVIFCRICLRVDLTHKYILTDIAQRKFIETLFKENGYYKDLEEHSYACFECRSVLHRSYNFIQKALRAQKALYELQENQELPTNTWLQNLDRKKYNIATNLMCCANKTYAYHPLDGKLKEPEENVVVKAEPSEVDNFNSIIGPTIAQNNPKKSQLDSSDLDHTEYKIDSKNKIFIETCTPELATKSEFPTTDTKFIPNVDSGNTDSYYNGDVKTEPEICILDDDTADNVMEYNCLDNFDPFNNILLTTAKRRKSTDVEIISSDETTHIITHIKSKKRKGKGKKIKKKKPANKSMQKSRVTLDLFSSDDEVKKKRKRTKFEWPAMPIFEERFRNRKNVNYRGLDDEEKAKKLKKRGLDDDFVPAGEDSSDESADNSYDSYDDEGRVIRRIKDTRVFPMECEECSAIVISKTDHHRHYMHDHKDVDYPYKVGNRFLCPHCGESVTKNRLKAHEERHAGVKTECDICHKEYSSRHAMQEHQKRVHRTGSRSPLVCDYCQMSFFNKADLLRHIRTHTGEKPFKCHLCDYRVAHKGNLNVHVRQFHQHMQIATKKKPKTSKDSKNTDAKNSKAKKKKKDKNEKGMSVIEENVEENSSGEGGSKRKAKDSGEKKKKRKRKRKVETDSDTE